MNAIFSDGIPNVILLSKKILKNSKPTIIMAKNILFAGKLNNGKKLKKATYSF